MFLFKFFLLHSDEFENYLNNFFQVVASKCLIVLLQLLDSSDLIVSKITLAEFEKFSFDGVSKEKIAKTLEKIVDKMDLFKPESVPSVVPQLIGMYGETLPASPYILEHLVNNYELLEIDTK